MIRLSPNFLLSELLTTKQSAYAALNSRPPPAVVEALTALCVTLLEPIRLHFGRPVIITSGYRCPRLNTAIGGSETSQHMRGEAADLHVPGVPLADVWGWVRASDLPYGQLILEGHSPAVPSWLHLSLGEPYRQLARSRQALLYDGAVYRSAES